MDGSTQTNTRERESMHRHIIIAIIEGGIMLLQWSDGALEPIVLIMGETALAE